MIGVKQFDQFIERSLINRFFKHANLQHLLQKLNPDLFSVNPVGYSFEGRSINLVKTGTGKTKIFLWSQMHGDEATATMALFDLFNFLSSEDPNELKTALLTNCTLYILPMVNPDGAEMFTRRNAQGIDINRDFLSQQTPEGRLLRQLRDEIKPDFGFNLHDQNILWSAGNSGNPATISLLAPPFNAELSINEVRKKAIQVVSCINQKLQSALPRYIGRWTDEFEPRAFGDNFQGAGTSTILIESGGYKDDHEKQQIRRLTFLAILTGLETIALNTFEDENLDNYYAIPNNEKRHLHYILRNCKLNLQGKNYTADVGLIAEEKTNEDNTSVTYNYLVEDVGDLSGLYGYHDVDVSAHTLLLFQPLICGEPADFILQDGLTSVLTIENGLITHKNL